MSPVAACQFFLRSSRQ